MRYKTPDLVLVNPTSRRTIYQSLGKRLTAVENPVWAGLIATFARTKGLSVEIIDAEGDELTPDEAADRVRSLSPVLTATVVYGHQPSASTQNMTGASAVAAAIKRADPSLPLLMLGGHVAALPERTLQEEDCDFVSSDEGLYTIVELVDALKSSSPPDLSRVRGLVYRGPSTALGTGPSTALGAGAARLIRNPAAPLVKELDADMSGVAWDLLPMKQVPALTTGTASETSGANPMRQSTQRSAVHIGARSAVFRRPSKPANR